MTDADLIAQTFAAGLEALELANQRGYLAALEILQRLGTPVAFAARDRLLSKRGRGEHRALRQRDHVRHTFKGQRASCEHR